MFYMRYPFLFLSILIFSSHAFGMEEERSFNKLRRLPIHEVIDMIAKLKLDHDRFNKRIHHPEQYKERQDNPTQSSKEHDEMYASNMDFLCKVLAEKFKKESKVAAHFNAAFQKGHFQDPEINRGIAQYITITKKDLCLCWPTTADVIKRHRKLFEFPSKLSILEFLDFEDIKKKHIVLFMPLHNEQMGMNGVYSTVMQLTAPEDPKVNEQNSQGILSYAPVKVEFVFRSDCPEPSQASIYRIGTRVDPFLIIKDMTKMLKFDKSPQDCFIPCASDCTLNDIFEPTNWLASLNSSDEEKQAMEKLNCVLTLKEKLQFIDIRKSVKKLVRELTEREQLKTDAKQLDATLVGQNATLDDLTRQAAELKWENKKKMCIFLAIGIVAGFVFGCFNLSKLDILYNKLEAKGLFLFSCIQKCLVIN